MTTVTPLRRNEGEKMLFAHGEDLLDVDGGYKSCETRQ